MLVSELNVKVAYLVLNRASVDFKNVDKLKKDKSCCFYYFKLLHIFKSCTFSTVRLNIGF